MNVVMIDTAGRKIDDAFAVAHDRLPGAGGIADARERAFALHAQKGLPHRRIEDWKYTDLRAQLRDVAPPATTPDAAALDRAAAALKAHAIDGVRALVLVDGVFAADVSDISDEAGVKIRTLQDALDGDDADITARAFAQSSDDAMASYTAAMMTDGVVISVAADAAPQRPLHIVHIAAASRASMATRSLLRIGRGASVTLVESFIAAEGAAAYQVHDALDVEIGDGAKFEHVRIVEDARDAVNLATARIVLGEDTTYNALNMVSGGKLSRYQPMVAFAGEGAHASVNGVNLLNGTQHGDTTLVLDHAVPHCVSREVFRAVLDDRARSVFQGRIIVQPKAQKTDAKMMTRALLLSDEAEADNKPELEIFADDVTCGHGATTGALDDSLLFYLRARGLSEKQAQALLIQAFVGEAIESIADERLRDLVVASAERWLGARA